MVLAESKTISFNDFITWLPERSEYRYELRDGEILELPKPRGKHSEVAGEISGKLYLEVTRLGLQYLTPVCPNCHAVIHLKTPPYAPHEVSAMLRNERVIPHDS
ncbi:Uma2 family endonuclease [Chamaesiphon sp. OTE_20_metabat_361]|uniref:Uma2 family endonuclease n=1 Tax=Chamaesiphon sp. OTE_20_metabat_361 TaxID=2964689 RepID=UPI00286C4F96|nr:Uma2 family endonuclease [Chamaesiphon sp. OTE_20_metabat_361]